MDTSFTDGMRDDLLFALQSDAPFLRSFILSLESMFGHRESFPPGVTNFLKCCSSISPVISYFPHKEEFLRIIDDISDGQSPKGEPETMKRLELHSPIICKFLQALPTEVIERSCLDLLLEMKRILLSSHKEAHDLSKNFVSASNSYSYFPCWQPCSARGTYVADRQQTTKDALKCSKLHRGHPKLMPGLFTVYCEHDICYGFEVMEAQESVNVPFTILRTRFPKAPSAIIYDNCCNLHNYALNRDPGFFNGCMFLVDRFHWKNHKACAESYNLRHYTQFQEVNSQINEQRNSTLKKLKSQLSYMSRENFVSHCKLFFWHRNRQKSEE